MEWMVREATDADRLALSTFSCLSGEPCAVCSAEGGNFHEQEVERYIRRQAIDARNERSPFNGHTLQLLIDVEGSIAGVIAHEQIEMLVQDEEVRAEWLVAAAVRSDLQGQSIEGHKLSSHLLAIAINDLADDPPRLVGGRVADCNIKSKKLLTKHGLSRELQLSEEGYVDVVGIYEDVAKTLPAVPLGT